jgi:hypothetical protein
MPEPFGRLFSKFPLNNEPFGYNHSPWTIYPALKDPMNFIPVALNIYVPYPSFFPFFHLPEYMSLFTYFITPSPFFSPFSQYP